MSKFLVQETVLSLMVCVLAIAGGASPALAHTTVTCLAENGQSVSVPIVVAPSADVARATYYPRPLILVDPAFEHFSKPARILILSHERHHVTHPYVTEDEADVYADRLIYMAGYSADVTDEAAKEVFRFGNATNGHSLTIIRIGSITKGYVDAARGTGGIGPGDDTSAQGKER